MLYCVSAPLSCCQRIMAWLPPARPSRMALRGLGSHSPCCRSCLRAALSAE